MTVISAPAASRAANPAALRDIRNDDCNLAIWERAVPTDFAPMISKTPQDIRFTAKLDDLPAKLAAELCCNRYACSDLHPGFTEDAVMLAHHFCDALGVARFELRLEVVTTDSCRKFHADYVRARLITTYVGPGTDWLNTDDAARVACGEKPTNINRMRTGDVGIFKGKLATSQPAIHRSPPISSSAGQRLLLVLNPAEKTM